MLKRQLTQLVLETTPFFDVGPGASPGVLRQVASCVEFIDESVYLRVIWWQR